MFGRTAIGDFVYPENQIGRNRPVRSPSSPFPPRTSPVSAVVAATPVRLRPPRPRLLRLHGRDRAGSHRDARCFPVLNLHPSRSPPPSPTPATSAAPKPLDGPPCACSVSTSSPLPFLRRRPPSPSSSELPRTRTCVRAVAASMHAHRPRCGLVLLRLLLLQRRPVRRSPTRHTRVTTPARTSPALDRARSRRDRAACAQRPWPLLLLTPRHAARLSSCARPPHAPHAPGARAARCSSACCYATRVQ